MEQIELHRHLDVSVRHSTLWELARERGLVGESTSLDSFLEKLVPRAPMKDLAEVLAQFSIFQDVLDRYDVLERVAFEAVEDCRAEGTRAVEFRYSPNFLAERSKLPWDEALDGFEAGLKRAVKAYPEMKAGLICIASRDYGVDACEATVDHFLKHDTRFIGLDLAGNEQGFPLKDFAPAFQRAARRGARITVHAGEAAGPENVWEAIEFLGARRIGHGVRSFQDPQLVEVLRERKICLEMCPTSNWITHAVPDLKHHPLKQALREGLLACVNTDDPAIFGVGLDDELRICREILGLTPAEIDQTFENAWASSFLLRAPHS